MKLISYLLVFFVIITSCTSQKKTNWNAVRIEYSAHSRGMFCKIVVEKQQVLVTQKRDDKPVAVSLTPSEWETLKKTYDTLVLETLPTLKAPTEKRLYDGAAIANLKITNQGKTWVTQSFDHGFPPKEIEKIITLLVSYTEK